VTLPVPIPVAFVMSSLDPGGTEHQMIELIERLDRARWAVHVISMRTHGRLLDRVARTAPIVTFPVRSFRHVDILPRIWSFAQWCRHNRMAVVHTVDLPANIFGLGAARLAGVPVRVANRRDVNPGLTTTELGLQRLAYTSAHRIVANCRAAADRLTFERVPLRKIAVIPNGIDPGGFPIRQPRADLRRVITVANLRAEKGHDVLLGAVPRVLRRFPATRFEIVGGGSMQQELTRRVEEERLTDAVTFRGHQDDVAARLDAADLFVLPSRSEAFPNAVLEAMASSLPVVASDAGGIPEVIEDGRNGRLAPPGDPVALADRICDLISDPATAARLGAAARHDVCTRYSFDRMVTQFQNLYAVELGRFLTAGHAVRAAI
jgi:glycosyltransferase involved in cell wall biosynthesis